MESSSALALPLAGPLAQALENHQAGTGLLSVKLLNVPLPLTYHFVLHQGTMRAAFEDAEQIFQRLQVVKVLQQLFLVSPEKLSWVFESVPFEDLPGEAVPMNLQSLLLSVQTGLYQQAGGADLAKAPIKALEPGTQWATSRIPLPEPGDLYQRSAVDVALLGGEAYALWQQLEAVFVGMRSVSAQQLAERLNIGLGQARIKIYRLVILGVLVPALSSTPRERAKGQ